MRMRIKDYMHLNHWRSQLNLVNGGSPNLGGATVQDSIGLTSSTSRPPFPPGICALSEEVDTTCLAPSDRVRPSGAS
jgi:hypothetical protein